MNTKQYTLDPENKLSILKELKTLNIPHWNNLSESNFVMKQFTAGITNKVYALVDTSGKAETLLLRVNGRKTEEIIDRDNELNFIWNLSKKKMGPQLYCVYPNALIYQFFDGKSISSEQMRGKKLRTLIAKQLAQFHSVPTDEVKNRKDVFDVINTWSQNFKKLSTNKKQLEPNTKYSKIIKQLKEMLNKEIDCTVCICHNDLLSGNIVYNQKSESIQFIDFEYCSLNVPWFDLANHFCEYSGFEMEKQLLPSKEIILDFLTHYLASRDNCTPLQVNERDLQQSYFAVRMFMLVSLIYWGIWALVQSQISEIDFDYTGYAKLRFEFFEQIVQEVKEEFPNKDWLF
ncbi:ethanolamine kinase 1 [Anaeramoeba flamelloides]|uniref:ethanolamine kinase n=1 Tax=Anaeramoeba flamelloides TaxID=1746091 RepID=A0AAV7Y6L3_9EUKA|nr:ethanolamine kinase [Anaeramoeba flamelloides]KAJ6236680.1 ethanolamine kinase 1 [Anaeramoeba flamelloides]